MRLPTTAVVAATTAAVAVAATATGTSKAGSEMRSDFVAATSMVEATTAAVAAAAATGPLINSEGRGSWARLNAPAGRAGLVDCTAAAAEDADEFGDELGETFKNDKSKGRLSPRPSTEFSLCSLSLQLSSELKLLDCAANAGLPGPTLLFDFRRIASPFDAFTL
ncbi:hypothetical protein L7F22_036692 [Adiantum nelumboides]|nr:hypothetical protein [Adiantum nelumboides]